jgi:pimeloyl-ACP methyl ester carboxylesterase
VAIPSYQSVTIDDAGHWVHHDQLDRFLEVVAEFLTE